MARLMAHAVTFYPDRERSARVVQALLDGGARYIELQFPYSDPSADGVAIQEACATALAAGFTVEQGWAFVEESARAVRRGGGDLFLMSYAGMVYAYGVERFVQAAARCGVHGLIVPDLPFDSDEGLGEAGRRYGVEIVPVVARGGNEARYHQIVAQRPCYIYAALRAGITGGETSFDESARRFVRGLREQGARVLAGFGVREAAQVEAIAREAHAVVVGSALVRTIAAHMDAPYAPLRDVVARLAGTGPVLDPPSAAP